MNRRPICNYTVKRADTDKHLHCTNLLSEKESKPIKRRLNGLLVFVVSFAQVTMFLLDVKEKHFSPL